MFFEHISRLLLVGLLLILKNKKLTFIFFITYPANNHLFKVNNRNISKRCKICSNLTMRTAERRHWLHSGPFIVNFEHISHLFVVFLLLTLNRQLLAGKNFKRECTSINLFSYVSIAVLTNVTHFLKRASFIHM